MKLVPKIGPYGKDKEHTVWLIPVAHSTSQPVINLPEGTYEIKYRLYKDRKGSMSYNIISPLFEKTVNIELNKGETKLITVSE